MFSVLILKSVPLEHVVKYIFPNLKLKLYFEFPIPIRYYLFTIYSLQQRERNRPFQVIMQLSTMDCMRHNCSPDQTYEISFTKEENCSRALPRNSLEIPGERTSVVPSLFMRVKGGTTVSSGIED